MRVLKKIDISGNLAVVGGGLAGVCASITAARGGTRVILIQDRPVLGGNASSEVRLWALGATSHMGNNNRWAREGGVIDELLTENLYRNREGNPVIFDTVLIDAVLSESNITLLLNTVVDACTMREDGGIKSVHAYNSQNETEYLIDAPLFCDSTGDGTLGYLAGADYVMGRDSLDEADSLNYPESFGELLGSTIFFYTRNAGKPVRFVAPSYALKDISSLKRLERISIDANGCDYWWIEWSGKKNTIHDSEEIKLSLWEIVFGIWNHIKNSGEYPGSENMTLDWVGTIPGKRESRRFLGDYFLTQEDLVQQNEFADAVSYGGWALDHHPSDGAYSEYKPCYQWHTKGVYSIPFRTMYSRNIPNLFLGGRLISVSRAAFGSTRTMMTCAHNGQAVGAAAVLCKRFDCTPADIAGKPDRTRTLQQYLLRDGQYIPGLASLDTSINKALNARISASSELGFRGFTPDGDWYPLEHAAALLLPLPEGRIPEFSFDIDSSEPGNLEVRILVSVKPGNFTPETLVESFIVPVAVGEARYTVSPKTLMVRDQYVFLVFDGSMRMRIRRSTSQLTGVLSVYNKFNKKVAYSAVQTPPEGSGIDSLEFWTPYRRPEAQNLALSFSEPLKIFPVSHLVNGVHRPVQRSNAWVADPSDVHPSIELQWDEAQELTTMLLFFDTDYDFAMESVQYDHPESVLPFCVTSFVVTDIDNGVELHREDSNHQGRKKITFNTRTRRIKVEILAVSGEKVPIGLFGIQCW